MKLSISPNWGVLANIVFLLALAAGKGVFNLAGVPAAAVAVIQDWSMNLAIAITIVNMVLHLFSSPDAGALNTAVPPKLVVLLALALGALLLAAGGSAQAQNRRPAPAPVAQPVFCDPLKLIPGCSPQQTEDSENLSLGTVWKRISAMATADVTYAKALADQAVVSNPAGGAAGRSQCYGALLALNQQIGGAGAKNADGTPMAMPDPHLVSTGEMAAEIIDELGPNSPVMQHCAAAAQALRMNTLNFVNAIVTGAISTGAVAAAVP